MSSAADFTATNAIARLCAWLDETDWYALFDGLPINAALLPATGHADPVDASLVSVLAGHAQLIEPVDLPAIDGLDRTMIGAPPEQWRRWIADSGLACLASAFQREIRGERWRLFDDHFGADAMARARNWRGATCHAMPCPEAIEELTRTVTDAGQACFTSWQGSLPDAWQAWLRQAHPMASEERASASLRECDGAAILRAVASQSSAAA